ETDRPVRADATQRKNKSHNVRNDVGLAHRQTADWIWSDFFFVLVIVIGRIETILELIGAIEDKILAAEYIHHVRSRGSGEQQRRTRRRIDDAMRRIHRNRKDRTFLPFKCKFLRIAVDPNFGGAAAIDDEELLFVHVLFGI